VQCSYLSGTVPKVSRRHFLAGLSTAICCPLSQTLGGNWQSNKPRQGRALIAITLDLEMSRNFPTWEQTHWDYLKGDLDEDSKKYALEASRRIKESGGLAHFFAVGRVFEQEKIDWLREIVQAGHPVGNHTYDHVNVKATKPEDIQFRFRRAPWLIQGKEVQEVIAENIRLTNLALKTRLGITPVGFRTPGGFANGISDRPDLQRLLLSLGFDWVSSQYVSHPMSPANQKPSRDVIEGIVKAQESSQPFVYESGLVEVPMSPISDINAFRNGRWKLPFFLDAIREAVQWTIEHGAVFDFLSHPSCLGVVDPRFETIDLICRLVREAGGRAAIADLRTIAKATVSQTHG
jgi:hypothetical protein